MLQQPVEDGWTDDRVEALKTLWSEGLSANQIAMELACGFSRSAVLGKVHRLKLPPARAVPHTTRAQRTDARMQREAVKPRGNTTAARRAHITPPAIEPEPFDMEDGEGVDVSSLLGIMELTPHTCKWPHGDPLLPGFGFCGKYTDHGPYCDTHAARAGIGYGRGPRP